MKKHLFLCGPAGCGKSRLLREELGPALAMAGGYVTEAVRDESGKISGVGLLPAAARCQPRQRQPPRLERPGKPDAGLHGGQRNAPLAGSPDRIF